MHTRADFFRPGVIGVVTRAAHRLGIESEQTATPQKRAGRFPLGAEPLAGCAPEPALTGCGFLVSLYCPGEVRGAEILQRLQQDGSEELVCRQPRGWALNGRVKHDFFL